MTELTDVLASLATLESRLTAENRQRRECLTAENEQLGERLTAENEQLRERMTRIETAAAQMSSDSFLLSILVTNSDLGPQAVATSQGPGSTRRWPDGPGKLLGI